MRYKVNLSSTPFRNRVPFWIAIFAGFSVVALFAVSLAGTWMNSRAERATLESQVELQQKLIAEIRERAPKPVEVAVTEEQSATMKAARELVERKAFSWSLLLSKIEPVIPHDVRVTNISISARTGSAESKQSSDWEHHIARLTMEVVAQKYSGVTELMDGMEKTGLFTVSPVQQNKIETGEVLFTLAVEYRIPEAAPAVYVAQTAGKEDER